MLYRIISVLTTLLVAAAAIAALVWLPWWSFPSAVAAFIAWLGLTRAGRQAWSVTKVGMSTLPRRLGAASVVVIGIAGVVGVLVAVLSMGQGLNSTLHMAGNDVTAIVLRTGSQAEMISNMDGDTAVISGEEPQVMRNEQGRPMASPEVLTVSFLPKKGEKTDGEVTVRGIGPEAWEVHPQAHLIAGRRFQPGLRELVVGQDAVREYQGLTLGASVNMAGQPWTVVGEFSTGSAYDSEVWADSRLVATVFNKGNQVSSVTVRLKSAQSFDAFKAAIATDPRLKVDVTTTRVYYDSQSGPISNAIRILGTTVGIIMAIGALFGALNTMYAAVASRTREIATLRAVGFRGLPVVTSVLVETILLALLGGLVGAALAWALFDNFTASTSNYTSIVFQFRVTPTLMAEGLKWALAIGFVGGLFPAVRAARMPVTDGLRES